MCGGLLFRLVAVPMAIVALATAAEGALIETVIIGDPGNPADDTGHGAVDYTYKMGKYEVTTGQYTEFLNAVAAEDNYGLYDSVMWTFSAGCKIEQSGTSGNYSYSVAGDRANHPVNFVSWGDAARFANWLHNGRPTGAQDSSTTEDGAYELYGAIDDAALTAITRQIDAKWFIPTENEWYKAAYYDRVDSVYYDYPMGTDAVPDNGDPGGDTGNSGNYNNHNNPYSTPVGHFALSASPYGTFDQGGNMTEWNESVIITGASRGARGGDWVDDADDLHASGPIHSPDGLPPAFYDSDIGFRVATSHAPEPSSMALLTCGTLGLLACAWRKKRRAE